MATKAQQCIIKFHTFSNKNNIKNFDWYHIDSKNKETKISELCRELGGITKQTFIQIYISPSGELRRYGKMVLYHTDD